MGEYSAQVTKKSKEEVEKRNLGIEVTGAIVAGSLF